MKLKFIQIMKSGLQKVSPFLCFIQIWIYHVSDRSWHLSTVAKQTR